MHSWKAASEIMAEFSGSIMWNCKKIRLLWESGYHFGEETDVKEVHSGVKILHLQPASLFISTYIVLIILCPFKLVKWDVLV